MNTVNEILEFLDTLAPAASKMDWDNVGLLCGSRKQAVSKILVALDPFEDVAAEAAEIGADLIVTHHPLIFQPVKNVTDDTSIGRVILSLARNGISAINAHTNLDVAEGGVNDVLAEVLGLQNVEVVPGGLLRIGNVPEQRMEDFLQQVKERLACPGLRYVECGPVRRVAVGGGACGSELMDAVDAGCDTFVTSDIKYNTFWDAHDLGVNLIDAGHFYTENPVCRILADKLRAAFPQISVEISQKHRDCMKFF